MKKAAFVTCTRTSYVDLPLFGTRNGRGGDLAHHSNKASIKSVLNTILLSSTLFASSMLPTNILAPLPFHLPPSLPLIERVALAATTTDAQGGGMSCVMSHCSKELSACMSNPQCAQGLGCFMTCAAQKQEGACQVRCTDLHENEQLRRFTKCTLADRQCYPALAADARYPSLPSNLWETNTLNKDFLSKLLRGRWYISAGLNEAFDCFDCQVHDFEQPRNQQHVADAVFSYRIKTVGDNFRTKEGKKHLAIVANSGEQIETEAPSFVSGKKWGIDAFSPSSSHPTTTDTKLILTIDPNYMDYADEWTVLSSDVDQYMVVAYRGTNAAWKGYGGLNVYTREPVSSFDDVQPFVRKGIELGLAKVGLTLQDLHVVDNSCK